MATQTISTFGNGAGILTSSANAPDTISVIFQAILAQILGFNLAIADNQTLSANPSIITNPTQTVVSPTVIQDAIPAWKTVRVAWQKTGQPDCQIDDNICVIRATPVDEPFSRVRDQLQPSAGFTPGAYTLQMGFTQIWNIHCELNGPKGEDNARLILSAITLDWVNALLQAQNLYLVVAPRRPIYIPYLREGRWWKRTDINFKYNEQVFESIIQPTAASVEITIDTDYGDTETILVNG